MDKEPEQFIGYLKFFGPSVEDGRIDIEKTGKSLIALSKLFKESTGKEQENISLKLGKVNKNCTELQIFFEHLKPVLQPLTDAATWLIIAKGIGITEFGKQFFGTIGQQIALSLFSKGKKLEKQKDIIVDDKIYVLLKNKDGEKDKFPVEIYNSHKTFSAHLKDLIQLEKTKEEEMKIGYYQGELPQDVANIKLNQKDFFETEKELTFEERLEEEFDATKAEQTRIIGKFIDYYGLAHKYHFSFQARKNSDEIGKQKILCKVDKLRISEVIDLLKPENQARNICIFGNATKNCEGKIDKMKIDWFGVDEDYDPSQLTFPFNPNL